MQGTVPTLVPATCNKILNSDVEGEEGESLKLNTAYDRHSNVSELLFLLPETGMLAGTFFHLLRFHLLVSRISSFSGVFNFLSFPPNSEYIDKQCNVLLPSTGSPRIEDSKKPLTDTNNY